MRVVAYAYAMPQPSSIWSREQTTMAAYTPLQKTYRNKKYLLLQWTEDGESFVRPEEQPVSQPGAPVWVLY